MPLTRRAFLKEIIVAAAGLCGVSSLRAEEGLEQAGTNINAVLKEIAIKLRKLVQVKRVDEHLVDHPTKALVQWRWIHFKVGIDESWFPQIETVNAALLPSMQAIRALPDAGLDQLFQEGFVDGMVKKRLNEYDNALGEVALPLYNQRHPFAHKFSYRERLRMFRGVEDSCMTSKRIQNPDGRDIEISGLARFGAGYALSRGPLPVQLLAAEDRKLDEKAEETEQNFGEETEEYALHVLENRDKDFVRRARETSRKISHLLLGAKHDLRDDIQESNAAHPKEQMSHVVVTVEGVE